MKRHPETVTDRRGNVVPNCQVFVKTLDGTLAALWSDNGLTPMANPTTTNDEGQVFFYAANGRYNITTFREGVEVDQHLDVTLFDPDDLQVLQDVDILLFDGEGAQLLDGIRTILRPASAANPASNGELAFERTDDTQLTIKLRGTDGVVRSVTLTLT